ncbi:hypothetical protein [Methylobacterium sp. sgz302541]|uniref:hypothetical protein n=1 Tax=unclassified Methylobacterium TaxID=2615210 RepID=UPI003D337F89
MGFDRQFVRLMAATILAIVAYLAPSAVQAHQGHAHDGQPTVIVATAAPIAEVILPEAAPVAASSTASLRPEASGSGCCPSGACKGVCCGDMVCCASGILSGPSALSPVLLGPVVLIPHDVARLAGIGPEALPEPPRTLA